MILKGDGCELPLTGYRFADPPDGPADGRLRLTANGTGMWVERDARHIRLRADGKWVTGHGIPPLPEHDVTVSGRPAVWLGVARTFGTTDIRWLARKQCEESGELRDAVRQWGGRADGRRPHADARRAGRPAADGRQPVRRPARGRHGHHGRIGPLLGEEHDPRACGRRHGHGGGARSTRTSRSAWTDAPPSSPPSDTWLETIGGRTRIRVRFDSGMVGSYPPGRISHRNV